jgi:hypothetical protein
MRDPRAGRHFLDEVEGHVKLVPADGAEAQGRVRGREKQHGDGGGQKLVVKHLDAAVQVRFVVEVREQADCLLG